MQDYFSTGEASRATGVPHRTLDYWAGGFITPSVATANGTGSERRYSFADLVALRVAKILRDAGMETAKLALVVSLIRSRKGRLPPRLVLTKNGVSISRFTGNEDYALIVDLQRIVAEVKSKCGENGSTDSNRG